jgi:creatinine amidohydrolase
MRSELNKIVLFLLLCSAFYFVLGVQFGDRQVPEPLQPPRFVTDYPAGWLEQRTTVQIAELTWLEVRDLLHSGYTRVLIPTGGLEQNGPYVALNKHDLIVRSLSERIATSLGHTLVAPVVSFVPEGDISPPTGHMLYPGTISVRPSTFELLLEDVISSFVTHGFKEIIVFGDSGDSQQGMANAVASVAARVGHDVSVRFLPEFYNYDAVRAFLRLEGMEEKPEGIHDELAFTLQLLAIDPTSVRSEQRLKAGKMSLNGVALIPSEKMVEIGQKILSLRSEAALRAITLQKTTTTPP